jgi:hypothetical protein
MRSQFQLYKTDRSADRSAEGVVLLTASEASSDNPIDHISAVFRENVPTPKPHIVATRGPAAAATRLSPTPAKPITQVDARAQFQLYKADRSAEGVISSTALEASSDNPIDHISAVFREFDNERER